MKTTAIYLIAIALLGGCRRTANDTLQREQQQYDVVQEGRTSTVVTSTISAPGEAAMASPAMTGTNVDTTSNFTLPQIRTESTPSQQQGTLAETLTMPGGHERRPPPPPPAPRPRPTSSPAEVTPQQHTEPPTTSAEPPPPTSSTNPPTTDTAPPPPPRDDPDDSHPPPRRDPGTAPPPPPTDSQPPPTTTTGSMPDAADSIPRPGTLTS